jgi:hypothetical protein
MTTLSGPLDNFVSEFTASLSQHGGDAALRRINAERLLRLIADQMVEQHQAEQIRVLSDYRFVGEAGADFLFQVDDYDIRLQFIDAPDSRTSLKADQLPAFAALLEDNPSTIALVLVWTSDDMLALPLSIARLRYLTQHPDRLNKIGGDIKPLADILRALVSQQTKQWDISLEQTPRSTARPADIRRLFEGIIREAIERERHRSYRYEERKQAAHEFPLKEEQRVILDVLREALEGVSATDLVPRLTRVSRRGVK